MDLSLLNLRLVIKFVEFKIGYHKNELDEVLPQYANRPIELPNEYNAVVDTIEKNLSK